MKLQIKILDYSQFEAGRSANGGAYGYEETAVVDGASITGHYWNTSDFSFCPNCGFFESSLRQHEQLCDEYSPSSDMEKVIRAWRAGGYDSAARKAEGLSNESEDYEINIAKT